MHSALRRLNDLLATASLARVLLAGRVSKDSATHYVTGMATSTVTFCGALLHGCRAAASSRQSESTLEFNTQA